MVLNKIPGITSEQLFVSASGGVNRNVFVYGDDYKALTGTIVYVSRIDTGKGWDVLIDAVSELKSKRKIIGKRVLFVGYGTQTELLEKK